MAGDEFEKQGRVIVVGGPPGAGKSTTAAGLARSHQFSMSVHLETDQFYRWIANGFVAPHLVEAHQQNLLVLDLIADTAAAYAEGGFAVIVDGVMGPWVMDRMTTRLAGRSIPLDYLVLRPSRSLALDRVRKRDGTTEISGAEVMFDQFTNLGSFEHHVIDSALSAQHVLTAALEAIDDGRCRLDN